MQFGWNNRSANFSPEILRIKLFVNRSSILARKRIDRDRRDVTSLSQSALFRAACLGRRVLPVLCHLETTRTPNERRKGWGRVTASSGWLALQTSRCRKITGYCHRGTTRRTEGPLKGKVWRARSRASVPAGRDTSVRELSPRPR